MNIPERWPTEEMLFAAREACDDMFQTDFIRAFKAALAAAPTPPASIAWPRECEGLCKAAEQFKEAVGELWKAENPDELQDGETAMSEEGARELHSERWKALDSAIYYMRKRMSAPPAQEPDLSQEARDWYAKRRSATPPAQWWKLVREYKDEDLFECRVCRQQFEVHKAGIPLPEECPNCNDRPGPTPLAQDDELVYQSSWDEVYWADISKTEFDARRGITNIHTRTLYTRPDSSELRKAAGEALKLLDKLGSGPTIENLRAALEGN